MTGVRFTASLSRFKSLSRKKQRFLSLALGVLASVGLFVFLLALSFHTATDNSDGATIVLEGSAMAHGNVLLHGWSLSLDSFWSIDGIFYMFAVLIAGIHANLLHIIPALIAALAVVVGIALARSGRRGLPAFAGGAVVVLIVGLPSAMLGTFFLAGPYHVGTALFCLIAFYCLRKGRFGWTWFIATAFLAAGILGDLQALTLGVIPVALAGLIAMLRCWNVRAGLAAFTAALTSTVLALLVRTVAKAIGTFDLVKANPAAGWSELVGNVGSALRYGTNLLGVGGDPFGKNATPVVLGDFHVIGLVVIVGSVFYFLYQALRGAVSGISGESDEDFGWRIEDLLVLAFFADLVTYCYLATVGSSAQARYLTAGVIFGAILGGRLVGQFVSAAIEREQWQTDKKRLAALFMVIAGIYGSASAFALTSTVATQQADNLGAFLTAHHLTNGIGGYWNSAITTVATSGDILIRPVIDGPSAVIVRYQRQSDDGWYKNEKFQFLSFNTALPIDGLNRASATATFGRPAHVYAIGVYRVFVWKQPITVAVKGAAD